MEALRTFASVWTAIGIWAVFWVVLRADRDRRQEAILTGVRGTRADVDTKNETTIGTLAADAETRRIREIPREERTATEQRHLDDAPLEEQPQGPDA